MAIELKVICYFCEKELGVKETRNGRMSFGEIIVEVGLCEDCANDTSVEEYQRGFDDGKREGRREG